MKPVLVSLVLVLAAALAGCTGLNYYLNGIDPTDLSVIRPGTSRQAIEKLLGKPVERERSEGHQIDTYEYDMGAVADPSKANMLLDSGGSGGYPGLLLIDIGVELIHQGYLSAAAKKEIDEQKGQVQITYAVDDTAMTVDVAGQGPQGHPFEPGQTTRADVISRIGGEPDLTLRGGRVLVYREAPEIFLIIEFDGDAVDAFTTTADCTRSGICLAPSQAKTFPPLFFAPPREDITARDLNVELEDVCAIYAYSEIDMKDQLVGPQEFTLDQRPAGTLHPQGYLWWLVSPGTHSLEIQGKTLDNQKHSPPTQIDCHAGDIYFIVARTVLSATSDSGSARTKNHLENVSKQEGREGLRGRKLLMNNFAFPVPRGSDPVGS